MSKGKGKSFQADVSKGVYGYYDPDKVGRGYACFISNADLTSRDLKPMLVPSLQAVAVPDSSADMFEFAGNWFFASVKQDWAAERVGLTDRIYYCRPGQAPRKVIVANGTQTDAPLGLAAPARAPGVTYTAEPVPLNVKLVARVAVADPDGVLATDLAGVLAAGTYAYSVGFKKGTDYLVPTAPVSITLKAKGSVLIAWDTAAIPAGVTAIVIYGRTPGYAQLLADEIPLGSSQWADEGTITPIGPPPPQTERPAPPTMGTDHPHEGHN